MSNRRALSNAVKESKQPKQLSKPKDIDYNSQMGYRDDSPFRNKSSIDINTPTGTIDMSNTGIPLMANGRYLPPYSGTHKFDTNVVREVPLMQAKKGGGLKSKKYSRSLQATNKFFRENPLFEKPKKLSKKRIYDPNAKYYQDGGFSLEGYNEDSPWLNENYKDLGATLTKGKFNLSAGNYFPTKVNQPTGMINPYISAGIDLNKGRNLSFEATPGYTGFTFTKSFQDGGSTDNYVEIDIPKDQIQKYVDGGYIVEEIDDPSIPLLNTYQDGGDTKPGIQNLPETTIYDPKTKKIQTGLFRQLKDAKDAYQNFTQQNKGKKFRLNIADASSSIEDLKKGIQLYKEELRKEKEQTQAELSRLENLKNKATLKNNKDIQNLKLKDLNTTKGKMKILDAIRNSNLSGDQVAALYKGYGLDEVDPNVKKGYGPNAQYLAKKTRQNWGDPEEWKKFTGLVSNAATALPLLGVAGAAGTAGAAVFQNPLVQAGMTGYGVYDAAANTIPESYRNFSEGDYLKGFGNAGLAALDLLPGAVFGDFKKAGQYLNKGASDIKKAYVNAAEGDNMFNYAWRSPASRFDDTAMKTTQEIAYPQSQAEFDKLQSLDNLTDQDKVMLKDYETASRHYTGRGMQDWINNPYLDKKQAFEKTIANAKVQSDEPFVMTRRINTENPELFSMNKGIYEPKRITSWSAGRDNIGNVEFSGGKDRLVIKNKAGESNILKNPYESLTDTQKQQYRELLKKERPDSPDEFIDKWLQDFADVNRNYERELILPAESKLKKLGKVKNKIGGYDYIMKPIDQLKENPFLNKAKQFFNRPPGPMMLLGPSGSGNVIKKNMNYYKQLLDSYDAKKMSAANRKFYNNLINTAKKQDGMVTEAQLRELDRLKTGNFDFGKRGFNKESLVQVEPKAPGQTPKSEFKSEIDWDKWNPEISKNPELVQEYNAIEEAAKANGTWMKNPDGSPFVLPDGKAGQHWTFTKGTPEQFVQIQSQNFKKAYPEGYDAWYTGRMKDPTEQFPLFAELYPEGKSIFGGDYHVATRYASTQPEGYDTFKRITTEFKPKEITKFTDADQTAKVHGLISPKSSNSFLFNARKQGWREIPVGSNTGITPMWEGQPIENFRESLKTTFKNPKTGIDETGYKVKSDDIAEHLEKNNMDYATIEDVVDGSVADYVRIHNLKSGNYPKSLWGNNGMFDLSNPNIYKAIIPTVGVTGLTGLMLANPFKGSSGLPQQKKGGITDDYIEMDIPKSKVQWYIDNGYEVEVLE